MLAGHAPFMTTLRLGEVIVRDGATRRIFTLLGGFADLTPEKASPYWPSTPPS